MIPRIYIRLVFILLSIVLTSFSSTVRGNKAETFSDYILIISSSCYADDWSTAIAKGIQAEIAKRDSSVFTRIEYADLTYNGTILSGRFSLQRTFILINQAQTNILTPTSIAIIGEEAWMIYRLMTFSEVWKKIPVTVCGVRPEIIANYPAYLSNQQITDKSLTPTVNTKGDFPAMFIHESGDEQTTLELINGFFPQTSNLVYINKKSYQDNYTLYMLRKILQHHPEIALTVLDGKNMSNEEIKEASLQQPEHSVILTRSYIIPQNWELQIPVFTLTDQQPKCKYIVGGSYTRIENLAAVTANAALLSSYSPEMANTISQKAVKTTELNKEAIDYFGVQQQAEKMQNVVYTNIPPSHFVKYFKNIAVILSLLSIALFFYLYRKRKHAHTQHILKSLERYKELYKEYQVIYENTPIGIALLNDRGDLLQCNTNANHFLFSMSRKGDTAFNLFTTPYFDRIVKKNVKRHHHVDKIIKCGQHYLRTIFSPIQDEETGQDNTLMFIIDNTQIWEAREEKETIHEIFNFAMEASSIGVVEYNLLTGEGLGTDAWYYNLGVIPGTPIFNSFINVLKDDQKEIEEFLQKAKAKEKEMYEGNLRIIVNGKTHWIRVRIKLTEYNPEKNRIIITEVTTNIDEQKENERELFIALQKAQESDKMKNAFIAKASTEIRFHTNEIVQLSTKIFEVQDQEERMELLSSLQENNEKLLAYISQIIESSKEESASK
ncbi:hypothetical protein D0T50_02185 [Bacteroides sp. 214]|uniref:hypothetical protein n=1 Tax=Bacteroides sp. 214 TaxID=2302935 RepID=UPI0013D87C6D|nr:hypothetical protein [Bacteroides sp. 214]NDW11696.1 hypothetical protein [Bacteroides sp. 214]